MTACRKEGMSIDSMPDMNCATERNTEVMFTAKPVWEKRVLNCSSKLGSNVWKDEQTGLRD